MEISIQGFNQDISGGDFHRASGIGHQGEITTAVQGGSAEPAPPAGQTYIGSKACSACHYKQYTSWKKTKHAKEAWESVPAKYQTDPDCLKCHATGYGQPSGFKDAKSTPTLVGTTCEACHGPGSEHEKACKPFLNKKTLSPEEEKIARDSIYKVLPKNVCVACHLAQAHEEHPKYDKQ